MTQYLCIILSFLLIFIIFIRTINQKTLIKKVYILYKLVVKIFLFRTSACQQMSYNDLSIWCEAKYLYVLLVNSSPPNSFLIVTVSRSFLYFIMGNPFKCGSSVFSVVIRSVIADLEVVDYLLKFVWIPSHVGITSNEKSDPSAKFISEFNIDLLIKSRTLIWSLIFIELLEMQTQ